MRFIAARRVKLPDRVVNDRCIIHIKSFFRATRCFDSVPVSVPLIRAGRERGKLTRRPRLRDERLYI